MAQTIATPNDEEDATLRALRHPRAQGRDLNIITPELFGTGTTIGGDWTIWEDRVGDLRDTLIRVRQIESSGFYWARNNPPQNQAAWLNLLPNAEVSAIELWHKAQMNFYGGTIHSEKIEIVFPLYPTFLDPGLLKFFGLFPVLNFRKLPGTVVNVDIYPDDPTKPTLSFSVNNQPYPLGFWSFYPPQTYVVDWEPVGFAPWPPPGRITTVVRTPVDRYYSIWALAIR
jgi:hypothetical protein